jgi:hypothetical protein
MPWKINMPIDRRLEPNAQLMEFRCQEMAEETLLGHLRKNQLVKQWEGRTMRVEVTRKVPPGNAGRTAMQEQQPESLQVNPPHHHSRTQGG